MAPTVRATEKPPAMTPKRARSKAHEAAKAAVLAEKRARPSSTPPTKRPPKTTHSARGSATNNPLPRAVSALGNPFFGRSSSVTYRRHITGLADGKSIEDLIPNYLRKKQDKSRLRCV